MPGKSRFAIAESGMKSFFKQNPRNVFSREQLNEIFEERRIAWNLPASTTDLRFIEQLQKRGILTKIEILFDGYINKKERYITADAHEFEIATSLINKSYLSHYSAMFLNGLTTQVPKTIYITFEQSKKTGGNRQLTQEAIDAAFAKPQRRAITEAIYGDFSFLILNGMFTGRAGIHSIDNIPVTNLERTLIDITVRPSYAGGIYSVLEAYQNALSSISLNKLVATLDNLDFIYPYHQAVGFYLERAGYSGKKLEELRSRKQAFKFYLTYEMMEKDFSEDWQLYYPKGM
ncbi:hypothetical protein AAE02nite_32010 [Adhaeribacter aerolatus]|uniref:AbiEi antitoxin C-terminal domain-containing protein n=1 Tax=Adhaeribacter aerolatus TaxID=670289 RepID=A0A512B164_9BACT|nr:hypothetical protein [Adhaeribacter aerolatus]GEO05537.1 hypothetical protein AAE02nite_32010 [Adhaeribacter aerolatus]